MADSTHNGHGSNGHSNGQTNGLVGHGVRFEPTDIDPKSLYVFTGILVAVVLIAMLSMWFLYRFLNNEVTERQKRAIAPLVLKETENVKPGDRLPNDDGKKGPILEGIRATDPKAPRSGILGYGSLATGARKTVEERLAGYGYHADNPAYGYIPIDTAIEQMIEGKLYKAREEMPKTRIGSVQHPYSFYPSDASGGRESQGTLRETKP